MSARIATTALAVVVVLVDVLAWGLTFALAWTAAAPGHAVEADRAYLVGSFAFLGLFAVMGSVALAATAWDRP